MKRCPECRRDYTDETLNYCLDDGAQLVEGPASLEPRTETLPDADLIATRIQLSQTMGSGSSSMSSAEYLVTGIKQNKGVAIVAVILLVAVIGGVGYAYLRSGTQASNKETAPALKMQPLAASGRIREAAISPDGKFLAFTESINGQAG